MLVVQLLPDQITAMWNKLREGIEDTLPGEYNKPRVVSNILIGLSDGRFQLWGIYDKEEAVGLPDVIVLTTILHEAGTATRNLLVYGLYSFERARMELFVEGMKVVKDFARANKCVNVVAYTTQKKIVTLCRFFGAKSETYLTMKVDE